MRILTALQFWRQQRRVLRAERLAVYVDIVELRRRYHGFRELDFAADVDAQSRVMRGPKRQPLPRKQMTAVASWMRSRRES